MINNSFLDDNLKVRYKELLHERAARLEAGD